MKPKQFKRVVVWPKELSISQQILSILIYTFLLYAIVQSFNFTLETLCVLFTILFALCIIIESFVKRKVHYEEIK